MINIFKYSKSDVIKEESNDVPIEENRENKEQKIDNYWEELMVSNKDILEIMNLQKTMYQNQLKILKYIEEMEEMNKEDRMKNEDLMRMIEIKVDNMDKKLNGSKDMPPLPIFNETKKIINIRKDNWKKRYTRS
jgi:hypothetical protein